MDIFSVSVIDNQPLQSPFQQLRLHAPSLTSHVSAGQRLRLQNNPLAYPIMQIQKETISVLYDTVDIAGQQLTQVRPHTLLTATIVGTAIAIENKQPVIIAENLAIAAVICWLTQQRQHLTSVELTYFRPLIFLGASANFPFKPRPSQILVNDLPAGIIAAVPLLEDWGIASRLASPLGLPGCYEGSVQELLTEWQSNLTEKNNFSEVIEII